ncbi:MULTISPECIES: LLM class flavin-dependent oxidoreductase [unclassified Rhodococcus (in: high G+C Gram-positive bacteria)]|uniref:LLM class flavin-dependent oxidoreductase n=1 Tax=unclassified Rhodococcus (in: high G+C Gram-positive bacteria) TaxID=192944 RepID=UPI000927E1C5|nr:LLM class flavin-dependent oxidoreductase [Rhodococcus sp. M8]OLL16086.1 luciferase [Rhodococcus sp. M8]QPG48444.1 LLM class flavin-dependent oxidoreductase [Rhodococcus sp. M8]
MHPARPSGTAPFVLSVLDNAHTGVGQTAREAFADIIALAQLAEQRGYHRFWMSEHHAMPAAAASSPQLMLSRLTGETEHIRLGAGGIMLPNHAPLVIAEQFGMLDTLAPGRIDLGVGRAPGTDAPTAAALRRHHEGNDDFPHQVLELLGFLGDDFPQGHSCRNVHAVPGPWQAEQNRVPRPETSPELWILGSSPYSARLAGRLGRPYAFALQFGDADIVTAMRQYRESFRPSEVLDKPYSLVSVGVVAHDDRAEARRQAASAAMAMLRMLQRKTYLLLPPQEVDAYPATVQEQHILDAYTQRFLHGTGPQVADTLERLQEQTGVDEVMLVVMGHSRRTQARTLELIADHYHLPELRPTGQPAHVGQG